MCRNIFCFLFLTFLCFLSEWGRAQNGLALREERNFYNCNTSNSAFTVRITNESNRSLFREGTYQIDWGDRSAPLTNLTYDAVSAATHRYESYGDFVLVFSAESVSGGRKSWTQTVHNLGNPVFNFATEQIYTPCVRSEMEIHLVDYENNSSKTVYEIDYGDGKGKDKYTQQDLIDRRGTFKHVYNGSSCPDALGFNLKVVAKYENGCPGNMGRAQTCKVVIPPIADFDFDKRVCINTSIGLENKTVPGVDEVCTTNYTSEWYIDDATVPIEEQSPDISFSTPGRHKIKLVVYNGTADCARSVMEKEIPIYDEVRADFRISDDTVCINTPVELTGLISGDTVEVGWVIVSPDGRIDTIKGMNVRKSFDQCGPYGIQFYAQGYCVRKSRDTALVVVQDPEVSLSSLDTLCPGGLNLNSDLVSYSWNCNSVTADWELTYPSGRKETRKAVYPSFTLSEGGTYSAKVALKGKGCPNRQVVREQKFQVYDTSFIKRIDISDTEICSGNTIGFTSHSSAHGLKYQWHVPLEAYAEVVAPSTWKSPSPEIRFPQWGTYEVKAQLSAVCNLRWDKSFTVKIKENPTVQLSLEDKYCPQVLDFATPEMVIYKWKGNPQHATWEVTPGEGGIAGGCVIDDVHALNPRIELKSPGKYALKVTVDPVGCPDNRPISYTKDISVYNNGKTLRISVDTFVCVGEPVVFQNTSHVEAEDIIQYQWNIEPSSGWAFKVGNAGSSAPTVEFSEDGKYEVTASITTCDRMDTTFYIRAKKNPEVTLKDLSELCPGNYDLSGFVTYNWFHNNEEVTWEIIGDYAFRDGTNETSLFPHIEFRKGTYELKVRLADVNRDCGNWDKSLAVHTYQVFDSALQVNIVPEKLELCEGETLKFTNHTVSGDPRLTYEWSVAEEGGYEFAGGEAARGGAEPEILFTAFGVYHVQVKITSAGGCNVQTRSFEIQVRGIPEVDFRPLANKCKGDYIQFTPDEVEYTRKNCDLTYHWHIAGATSGDWVSDSVTAYPRIGFPVAGRYEVQLTVEGQCGGARTYSRFMNILETHVEAMASPSVPEGCTPLTVDFINDSGGDSLTCRWRIEPVNGWHYEGSFSDTSRAPTVTFLESGDYQVHLYVRNICLSDTATFGIRAYSTPVIVPQVADIKDVCEKDYVFTGRNELNIDEKNDSIIQVEWTVTPDRDYEYVNGTDGASKYPELVFKKGTYRLEGKYWNHCHNAGEVQLEVVVDEFIPIEKLRDTVVCSKTDPFLLTARPVGGEWFSEEGMVTNRNGESYFDPYIDAGKDYEVIYTYRNRSCEDRDTMTVHTIALPVVKAGADQEICINNETRILVPVEPVTGGWWEGPGIEESSRDRFTPGAEGVHLLRYYFKDTVTGCRNWDDMEMMVWGLPDTAFVTDPQYCMLSDALFQPRGKGEGNRFHWIFGDTATAVSWGDTIHQYQKPGFVQAGMIAEAIHRTQSCFDTSAYRTIEIVNIPPPADFTLKDTVGCGPFWLRITVKDSVYQDPNLRFAWDFGNGMTSASLLPPDSLEYRSGVWDTVYTIRFDVFNDVCTQHYPKEEEILVYSSPKANFVKQHEWECAPMLVRFQNLSTGDRNQYTWLYGDDSVSYAFEGSHIYREDSTTRIYDVTLIAKNNCGADTFMEPLTVKPQTIHAFFQTPDRNLCVGEEVCFINKTSDKSFAALTTQWDFGDHAQDTAWDACHAYRQSGDFKVFLYVHNGCGFDTISDFIHVYPLPELSIKSEDELCENDTFHFELVSDLPLQRQQWDFGDSIFSLYRNDRHRYEGHGKRRVKVWALSASPAVCRNETVKEIMIHPVPVITVNPIDTAACAPFLYQPEISGEGHLMWDYGDGSELTSALEHEYVNETDEVLQWPTKLYAESDKGCRSEYSGEVIIYNVPRAALSKRLVTQGKPQVVEFINLSEMYDDCIWYLPFGRTVHAFEDQQVSFEETELYTISLAAVNRYGCRDSVALEYQVVMRGLFFPNTFIPSHSDPRISRFNGTGIGLKEYRLEVFDQYGNKVWETTALENGHPSEGWDGRNKNGELLPQGVYIWRAQATFLDNKEWTGKNSDSGEEQTTQGVVLMLKNN